MPTDESKAEFEIENNLRGILTRELLRFFIPSDSLPHETVNGRPVNVSALRRSSRSSESSMLGVTASTESSK
jgi:hypothetical protein